MTKSRGGILLFRFNNSQLEVLIAHPGGPFYAKKDLGVWDIPKGTIEEGEELFNGAVREFEEEIGFIPDGEFIELGNIKNNSGALVHIWALESDFPKGFVLNSNTFEMEWPPRSGKIVNIPEMDKAEFTSMSMARARVWPYLNIFFDRLEEKLGLEKSLPFKENSLF
jgi:predicted NUDIX family NTP pyrophosphohydrolase